MTRSLLPISLFILTVASGLWLSRLARPYHVALFNLHKLVALAVVVFLGIQTVRALKYSEVQALLITMVVIVILSVALLFLSGALLSTGHSARDIFLTLHKIAPFTLAFCGGALLWLIAKGSV